VLDGPPVRLGPAAAQALSMALHELATNAIKYGALSNEKGRLTLSWTVDRTAEILRLEWAEMGGPPLAGPPTRAGFGTRVLKATLCDQLGGTADRFWNLQGLTCRITLPLGRACSQTADAAEVVSNM
jgi:two-component sensor histidine kinase